MLAINLVSIVIAAIPYVLAQTDHSVSVGAGGVLVYEPEFITAQEGDTVTFTFFPKNHTVTQSSFADPCFPNGGFDSGFQPVSANSSLLPTYTVTVSNATTPIWIYCGQDTPVSHCGAGMVFAINPPAEGQPNSFSAFKALAIQLNGTSSSFTPPAPTYTTPPAPEWQSATATVSDGSSTWVSTYTSYDGTPAPTYAPNGPQTHSIVVGENGTLTYDPANITAAIGDIVEFTFRPKNHTVTQSSFLTPCQKAGGGFASGFQPVDANITSDFPTFSIVVNDTAPIWGYCGQVGHCGQGMVFSINAVESGPNNFEAFQQLARETGSVATNTSSSPNSTTSSSSSSGSGSGSGFGGSNNNGALNVNAGKGLVTILIVALGTAVL